MSYTVQIRKNDTGEIRDYVFTWDDWEEGDLYWWTDGNMGCDCNRYLYFKRAHGDDEDWDQAKCGDGAYSVKLPPQSGTSDWV